MTPFLLALALISPVSAPAPAAPIALVALARADPAEDAIKAYDAARAALVALRDQLVRDASAMLEQAAEITKKLGGTAPPGPKPPDPPGPVLTGHAEAIRKMALATVPDYIGRPARAQKVATELFADISSKISQAAALSPVPESLKPFVTVAGIQQAYNAQFREVVGSEIDQWKPFAAAFGKYGTAEQQAGRLRLDSPAALAAFFDEAAKGLLAAFSTQQRGG